MYNDTEFWKFSRSIPCRGEAWEKGLAGKDIKRFYSQKKQTSFFTGWLLAVQTLVRLVRTQKDFYFYFLSDIRTGHIFNSPGDTLINSACLCERFAHCAAGLSASSDSVNYSRGDGQRWRVGGRQLLCCCAYWWAHIKWQCLVLTKYSFFVAIINDASFESECDCEARRSHSLFGGMQRKLQLQLNSKTPQLTQLKCL